MLEERREVIGTVECMDDVSLRCMCALNEVS